MSSEAPPLRQDEAEGAPPGLLLVLSAPSGAGKTTLARRFVAAHTDATFSISVTTRAPRGAERDGVDYHFVSGERFEALVEERALAEWADVHGRRYGTLKATVDQTLARGQVAIFDIDVQGGEQLQAAYPAQALTVFILPPDEAELARRLRGRSTESEAAVAARLAAARGEVARGLAAYQYVLINDDLEAALSRLELIVRAARAALLGKPDRDAESAAAQCRRGVAALGAWRAATPP
jgi:guanylate kinase